MGAQFNRKRPTESRWLKANRFGIEKLSRREKQCVKLYADGEPIKSIAAFFGLSIKTVDVHLRRAKEALGISNNVRLIKWAILNGISPL